MSPGRHHPQPLSSLTRDHIKAWKLLNKGRNSCYANSLVLSLLWSETFMNQQILLGPLGSSLRSLAQAGRTVDVWSLLPWIQATRTWPSPRRQHDIAEFLSYLRPKLNATLITG